MAVDKGRKHRILTTPPTIGSRTAWRFAKLGRGWAGARACAGPRARACPCSVLRAARPLGIAARRAWALARERGGGEGGRGGAGAISSRKTPWRLLVALPVYGSRAVVCRLGMTRSRRVTGLGALLSVCALLPATGDRSQSRASRPCAPCGGSHGVAMGCRWSSFCNQCDTHH